MDMTKTNYFLDRDGAIYRVGPAQRLGYGTEDLLAQFAQSRAIRLRSAAVIDGHEAGFVVKTNYIVIHTLLRRLVLRADFRMLDGEVISPSFATNANSINIAPQWKPPSGMRLHFATKVVDTLDGYMAESSTLFAQSTNTGRTGTYMLPISNMYEDGRICLGREPTPKRETALEVFADQLNRLYTSPWNSDLAPNLVNTAQVFRFSLATIDQLPPANEWETYCRRVSSPIITEVLQ